MATAYTIIVPTPAGVPSTVEVHITAMRADGKPLTREELAALASAYPPPTAAGRKAVADAIEAAAPSTKAKPSATKPRKAPAKRAAARRPSR